MKKKGSEELDEKVKKYINIPRKQKNQIQSEKKIRNSCKNKQFDFRLKIKLQRKD
jgi:hypothetical protein